MFSHSWFGKYAIVSKVSHEGNYPSRYVVVPLKVDGTLCMDTQFLGCMDCGLVGVDWEHNQHAGSHFDLYVSVILCVHGLMLEL